MEKINRSTEAQQKPSDLFTTEQDDFLAFAIDLLRIVSGDGENKRRAGLKVPWQIDSHEGSFFGHVAEWKKGNLHDPDSKLHPMAHAAWRAIAIAYQETKT